LKVLRKLLRLQPVTEKDSVEALNREIMPGLREAQTRLNDLLSEGDVQEDTNASLLYSWDMTKACLFLSQSTSVTVFPVIPDDGVPVGKKLTLVVENTSGGVITIAFSSEFASPGASLAAGESAAMVFLATPLGWAPGVFQAISTEVS